MKGDGSGALEMLVGSKHIYIFVLHVFNEAFQLEAFLEDIMRLVYSGLVEIGVDFVFLKKGMSFLQLVAFLVFF